MNAKQKIFIGNILSKISKIIPKNNNEIVIFELMLGDYDSTKLYNILKEYDPEFPIKLYTYKEHGQTQIIKQFLTHKNIIYDDLIPVKPQHQKIINIWHGAPGKKTGLTHPLGITDVYSYMNNYITHFQTYSTKFNKYYKAQFGISDNKFFVMKSVRHISMDENIVDARDIFDLDKNSEVILYAPTYRYNTFIEDINANIQLFKNFINLIKNDSRIYIIRPHHKIQKYINIEKEDNIFLLNDNTLKENNIWIYDILPSFDTIITDFSSILFDAIYADVRIIRWIPDHEKSTKLTGFLVEDVKLPKCITTENNITELLNECKYNNKKYKDYWFNEITNQTAKDIIKTIEKLLYE